MITPQSGLKGSVDVGFLFFKSGFHQNVKIFIYPEVKPTAVSGSRHNICK